MPTLNIKQSILALAVLTTVMHSQAFAKGVVTFYDPNNAICNFEAPEEGSGETKNYMLFGTSNGCYPSPRKLRTVAFSNMPSAMEITFSSRADCREERTGVRDYFVKFKTTATGTSSPDSFYYPFELLQGFTAGPKEGKVIFRGLKLIDKLAGPPEVARDETKCLKMTASRKAGVPELTATSIVSSGHLTDEVREHKDVEQVCTGHSVITARYHKGDEEEPTHYRCSGVGNGSTLYHVTNRTWSEYYKESGLEPLTPSTESEINTDKNDFIWYECPGNTVMTGRHHKGNEDGNTRYQCATLIDPTNQNVKIVVAPESFSWHWRKESSSDYEVCQENEVMLGRAHQGDENKSTWYKCGKVRSVPVTPGAQ